jgi:uncharacterized protein (DUF1697 family)
LRYIAFLRAVNVGGRVVKMARLRELFAELGLGNVRSYIQSGNVFFETDEADRAALTGAIERHLHAALGYEVGVLLRTVAEVEEIIALDPFREVAPSPDVRLCVVFVSGALPTDLAFPLVSPKGDVEIVGAGSGAIFLVSRLINGRPADPTKFVETSFGVKGLKATTRFYGTTVKILEAARGG